MQPTPSFYKWSFRLATGGLIAFCLLFGAPFLSTIAAGQVLEMAGCRPPSFDMQAVCPAGSYAEPFVPLGHWLTSVFAPLILVKNFWGLLIVWGGICLALAFASGLLDNKDNPDNW